MQVSVQENNTQLFLGVWKVYPAQCEKMFGGAQCDVSFCFSGSAFTRNVYYI